MTDWLDIDHLYLSRQDGEIGTALRLLPLMQIGPSPRSSKNACYFFNRLEKQGVRFLSYHYTDRPELTAAFEDTTDTIRMLSDK